MEIMDTRWFTDTLADRQLSQRRLAKLLGCDPASVNRLVHGQRALRFDEAEHLAPLLGVPISEVIQRAGVELESTGATAHLVGYIDGAGEAHIDWRSRTNTVEALPDMVQRTVAIQYRTAMTSREVIDGWMIYVEPPNEETTDRALHRFSLIKLDTDIMALGLLRRGYETGKYNITQCMGATSLENVGVSWATPVLLLRP